MLETFDPSQSPLGYVNKIRTRIAVNDLATAAELLIGADGIFPENYQPVDYKSIQNIHHLAHTNTDREVAFICGHLNGWRDKCLRMIASMQRLTELGNLEPLAQLNEMLEFWRSWGISDYLNRKLVYYMNLAEDNKTIVSEYRRFTQLLNLESAPEPYFSTMELISERYPYFPSIRVWVDILNRYTTNDFRQHNALHNVLPVPLSINDAGAYLRKSFSMSVPDELCA